MVQLLKKMQKRTQFLGEGPSLYFSTIHQIESKVKPKMEKSALQRRWVVVEMGATGFRKNGATLEKNLKENPIFGRRSFALFLNNPLDQIKGRAQNGKERIATALGGGGDGHHRLQKKWCNS
ncbi:hypothetical protein ACA910_011887 [Epithemia clementina (nom. ined.)]